MKRNKEHVPCWSEVNGQPNPVWIAAIIRTMAGNLFYTDNSFYRKMYRDENHRQCKNKGELDQYLHQEDHPVLIDMETFEKAQVVLKQRGELYGHRKAPNRYAFFGKVYCSACGGKMNRGGKKTPFLQCANHVKKVCSMKPEDGRDHGNTFTTLLNKLAYGEEHLRLLSGWQRDTAGKEHLEAKMRSIERRMALLKTRAMTEKYMSVLKAKKTVLDAETKAMRAEPAKPKQG